MRKYITITALVAGLIGFSQAAQADRCEYHQWTMNACQGMTTASTASCGYYHWPMDNRCVEAAPVAVAPAPVILSKPIVLKGVTFELNSAKLTGDSESVLDKNVAELQRKPNTQIVVTGHTDSQGANKYNTTLSDARAATVRNYFISQGIDPSRVTSVGMGETNPIADNSTSEGRAENRRIELSIR